MKTFPAKMIPDNIEKFGQFCENRQLCYLRENILNYIYEKLPAELIQVALTGIERRELKGFDLTVNSTGDEYNLKTINMNLVNKIRDELHALNWKTKVGYGNTVLFIYDKDSNAPNIAESTLVSGSIKVL